MAALQVFGLGGAQDPVKRALCLARTRAHARGGSLIRATQRIERNLLLIAPSLTHTLSLSLCV